MRKIIIDTNFLLMPYQFKVDIFSEIDRLLLENYSLFIIDRTMDELNKIIETQKGKHRRAALLGLMMLGQKNVGKIRAKNDDVDSSIIAEAEKGDCIVATHDSELKKKLRKMHVPLIILRSRSHLELVGI